MSNVKRFEHYTVTEREDGSLWELGRGAMGVTYKATDTDLHCTVALKVISPAILNTEGTTQRFLREARAAAQLRHPNIATVLRLGKTDDGTHFYAMEFCEGDTLEQLVANEGPVDTDRALEITLQVAKALVVAEEHHVVHRDIKPSNLIIGDRRDEGSVVKVIDFGLAKSVAGAGNAWSSMTLATAGFIGTAHFSSPEQLEEGEVDVRSDIYSLGATLWFMLTGKPMFSGSVPRVMSQHLSSPPPWEQLDSLGVSDAVRQLLDTMLAKSPKDRPQNAVELKQKIQFCLQGSSVDAKKRPDPVIAQNTDSTRVLNKRWKLLEAVGAGGAGQLYRAIDLAAGDRVVALRFIEPQLGENKTSWAQLERAVQHLEGAPDGAVHPIQLDREQNERPFLVIEWVNGMPLSTFLRRRGSLPLKEILHLLEGLVPAFDYAVAHQIECAPFSKNQVILSLPGQTPIEEKFAELIQKPVTEWPEVRAMIDLLPVHANDSSANETFFSMQTILPGGMPTMSGQVPRLPALGLLVYELLGGTARAPGRYVPVARLSAEGNDLLKRTLDSSENAEQPLSGAQFLDRLTLTAGFEPAWKPPAPVVPEAPLSPVAHSDPRAQIELPKAIKTHPILFVAGALVLIIGWIWLKLVQPVQESGPAPPTNAARSQDAATNDSRMATTPPPSAPPQLKLPGSLVSSEYSPKGDIRVEHRSGRYVCLIAANDEAKHFCLQTFVEAVDTVFFSPDENWFVLNKAPHSTGGSSQLYYRIRSGDVEYAEAAEITPGKSLTDSLWHHYLKDVGLPDTTSRDEVGLTATEWQSDSTAIRFRLDSFGPDGRKNVPQAYECSYELQTQRFHSITDTTSIRTAITSTSLISPPPVATVPSDSHPEAVSSQDARMTHLFAGTWVGTANDSFKLPGVKEFTQDDSRPLTVVVNDSETDVCVVLDREPRDGEPTLQGWTKSGPRTLSRVIQPPPGQKGTWSATLTVHEDGQTATYTQEVLPLTITGVLRKKSPANMSPSEQSRSPASPPSVASVPDGRYPETGIRVFTAAELQNWSSDQLRYAINEIFARHGAVFPDRKLQKEFEQFAWYHSHPELTFDQIENSLPDIERQNVQLFGNVRDAKKATQKSADATPRKLFAGTWEGTLQIAGYEHSQPMQIIVNENETEVNGDKGWIRSDPQTLRKEISPQAYYSITVNKDGTTGTYLQDLATGATHVTNRWTLRRSTQLERSAQNSESTKVTAIPPSGPTTHRVNYAHGKQTLKSVYVKAVGFNVLIPTEIFPDWAKLNTTLDYGYATVQLYEDNCRVGINLYRGNTWRFEHDAAQCNPGEECRRQIFTDAWFLVQRRVSTMGAFGCDLSGAGIYRVGIQRPDGIFVMTISYVEESCPFSEETLKAMARSFGAKL